MAKILLSSVIHDTIKQRLRASLQLSVSAKQTLAQATHFAREIGDDGAWSDLDYLVASSGTEPHAHLGRILILAQARRSAPGMLETALWRALDFWLAHDFRSSDWRCDQIHTPRIIGETALLCEKEVSGGAWEKIIEILTRSRLTRWVPGTGWLDWSGADLLGMAYNVILRGCLENTPALFDAAFVRIFREIRLAKTGEEGIQADMSFYAPGTLQSESVSFAFTQECAQFIALAHGTPWQISADSLKFFASYLLDAQQWMIYEAGAPPSANGSEPTSAARRVENLAVAVGQLAQLGNPPRRQELTALSHRLLGRGAPLSGHRYFWRSNLCVHRRPSYYACLHLGCDRPVSDFDAGEPTRYVGPEPLGHVTFARPRRDAENLPSPRHRRRLPGMTVLHSSENNASRDFRADRFGGKRFAGGVSEGEYGLGAMRLAEGGLSGRKAWFFFDESFVCLGSDIQASAKDLAVLTCIEERALHGPATVWTGRGTVETLTGLNQRVSEPVRRVEHDGFIYDFAGTSAVTVQTASAADVADPGSSAIRLSVQIDHGSQPQGGRYAYTVLPVGDDAEHRRRVTEEISQLEILANSALIQAVRHQALRLVEAVFWEAGVLLLPGGGRVAVNQPCLLLCRKNAAGETRLTMSSPTRQQATVHVEYNGKCLCFELPGGADAGRSVSRQL